MNAIASSLALILGLLAGFGGAALAGDASGFDPAAVDQCLAGGPAEGCAEAGIAACLDAASASQPAAPEGRREQICYDAAHQVWDARLGTLYEKVVAGAAARGIHPEQDLRAAERAWIAFRDARCTFEAASFGVPPTGPLAGTPEAIADDPTPARCLLAETQRHYLLLLDWEERLQ